MQSAPAAVDRSLQLMTLRWRKAQSLRNLPSSLDCTHPIAPTPTHHKSNLHLAEPLSGRDYSSSVRWAHACLGARMPERCTGNGSSSSLGPHCELPDRSSVRGLNTAPDRTWDEVDLFSAVDWRLLPGVCVPIRLLPRQCACHRKPGASATGSRGAVCCVRMW